MKLISTLVVVILVLGSCESESDELLSIQKRMSELTFDIEAMINDKSCSGTGDCGTIAFGSKACGGPVTYLIFSTTSINQVELETLVNEFNQLETEVNRITGRASDCALVPQPTASCISNTCQAIYLD